MVLALIFVPLPRDYEEEAMTHGRSFRWGRLERRYASVAPRFVALCGLPH